MEKSREHSTDNPVFISDQGTTLHSAWPAWVAAVILAVGPRLLRMIYPEVWIEDAKYLYHAYTLLVGHQPYIDGIFAHPPTFEGLLAALFHLFGVGYRIAEVFSAVVMSLSAVLLYDLCRRLMGQWAGLAAAAAFSLSPLLFRYHVYEREVFTLFFAIAAFWTQTAGSKTPKSALLCGGLAGLAITLKLSAVFYLPPLIIVYLIQNRIRLAVTCLTAGLVVGAGTWLLIFVYFGWTAYLQQILFHFVKGGTPGLWQNFTSVVLPNLNFLLVTGTGGLILGVFLDRRDVLIAAGVLFTETAVFFGIVSESVVPHNMIDLILPLSIGTGYAAGSLSGAVAGRGSKYWRAAVLGVSAIVFISLGALKADYITRGWGYINRAELVQAAAFLRKHVPSDVRISAPQYLAAEAQRIKIIDDRELTGPYLWMLKTLKEEGFDGLKQHKTFGSWSRLVWETIGLWRQRVDHAIKNREAGAAVWDSLFPEWRYHYRIDVELEKSSALFSSAGYAVHYRSGPYVIWLPVR